MPRDVAQPWFDRAWPTLRTLLIPPIEPPFLSFAEVVSARRSRRKMKRAPLRETLAWLNYSTTPVSHAVWNGMERMRAPALSSGALASTTPVLLSGRGCPRLYCPRPLLGAAIQLAVGNPEPLKLLRSRVDNMLPEAPACDIVVLLTNFGRLNSAYDCPESLAWRDAGAMLQILSLTATAFGLGFCPLGLLGGEAVQAVDLPASIQAVGIAMVGI